MSDTENVPLERRRRSPLVIVILAVLVAAAVGVAIFFLRPGGSAPASRFEPREITRFSGTGDRVTDPFEAQRGWQIHWENEGQRFVLAVRGDVDLGTLVTQREPGSGITTPVGSGTFRLDIKAAGPWSIRIIQAEPAPTPTS